MSIVNINLIYFIEAKMPRKHKKILECLLRIRKASQENLPFGHSNIPFDMLVVASYYENLGEKLTVKNLFANLNYSETGLRLHFRRLISKGWLKLEVDIKDKRSRVVAVTDKFRDAFDKFADQCDLN